MHGQPHIRVQLHISALNNSHLQVVHESLKVVIQDLIWAVYSGGVGEAVGTRSRGGSRSSPNKKVGTLRTCALGAPS